MSNPNSNRRHILGIVAVTLIAGVIAGLVLSVGQFGRNTPTASPAAAAPPMLAAGPACSTKPYNRVKDFGHEPSAETRAATVWHQQNVDGTITDPYSGIITNSAAGLDDDHVVPLEVAWVRGANCWPAVERTAFARDLHNLILVNAHDNRSKGSQTLDVWQPSHDACGYARTYMQILTFYRLPITPEEDATLSKVCAS